MYRRFFQRGLDEALVDRANTRAQLGLLDYEDEAPEPATAVGHLGDVAMIVGHDDIQTTESYREPDEEMVRSRLARLEALMFSAHGPSSPTVSGTVAVRAAPSDR